MKWTLDLWRKWGAWILAPHFEGYTVILADPPWSYDDKLEASGAKMGSCLYHYKTMSIEDICALPIQEISAKDCILFLWCTMPKLREGLRVVESWGFEYKTVAFTWIKLNPRRYQIFQMLEGVEKFFQKNFGVNWGLNPLLDSLVFKGIGRWVQGNSEVVLLATKGKPKRVSRKVSQVVLYPRGDHSVKPPEVMKRIEKLMGTVPRIELFARERVEGWDSHGNEIEADIEFKEAV